MVRFGIIGLGGIAARFAEVLKLVKDAELMAVASRDKKRSENFAEKFHAAKVYDNYTELIEDSEVDVIYVALTHNFHYDIVRLCLNNGKGVLCEKPLVMNKKDAEELVALSREKNVLLMEAMWTRFIPAFKKAKQWVHSGKIGEVKLVNASFCFYHPFDAEHRLFNPKLAGGSLYDVGVYPIEFTTGILGEDPSQVTALASFSKTGVDDFAVINMKFESGALAALSCGITADTNRDAHIYGTDGNIVVYNFIGATKCELYDKDNNLKECFEEHFEDGFIYEIKHFIELYQSKKVESDIIPLKDTITCAGIFDELMKQWGK